MKLFLRRFLLFILPMALLVTGLEISIRKIPNSYELKNKYVMEHGSQIETLILGSSHTFYGLNPKWFSSNTFNAANVSQSPEIDKAVLDAGHDQLSELKHVIIRLSYDTLFENIKDSPEEWRLKDYKLYTNLELDYKPRHHFELTATNLKECLNSFKEYYVEGNESLTCDSLGFGSDLNRRKPSDLILQGPKIAKKHTAESWDLLDSNIKYFESIVKLAEQNQVQLLVITPPCFSSYVDLLDGRQLSKMIEVGESLEKLSSQCTYINFMTHKDFDSNDFFDPDHLNERGARKFSIMLNDLINN